MANMLKKKAMEPMMAYTKLGGDPPSTPVKYMNRAIHGIRPAKHPKMKEVQSVFLVVWLCSSIMYPNRFMQALTLNRSMMETKSYIPHSQAITTSMKEDDKAYSNQRALFMLIFRFLTYHLYPNVETEK